MRRWNRFLLDMLDLSLHATEYEYEEPGWPGELPEFCIGHKFSDPNKLPEFRKKWRLFDGFDYTTLVSHTRTL
jgi:hypothetical protein